ncbi:hypothetical protein SpCBS45565_g00494 [Spizellomyces sp. 'palustris']|nr:hypothetical protein SpCBS45565_g00494 [Spizellomyces sp. 'palustris']
MIVERKPLSLPPPVVFAPRPIHTTLQNAHIVVPPPLPPTPPPPPFDPSAPLPSLNDIKQGEHAVSLGDATEGLTEDKQPLNGSSTSPSTDTSDLKTRLLRARENSLRKMHGGESPRKPPQYDFIYADHDSIENEINEFYNYQDKAHILEGKVLFHSDFATVWASASAKVRRDYIGLLLERLELRDPEERYTAAKKLLYIAQGVFAETSAQEEQLRNIKEYNRLLFELGALEYYFGAVKVVSNTLDVISRVTDPQVTAAERQVAMDLANGETSVYLSLLCLMVEVNSKDPRLANELMDVNPTMAGYLFSLVAQLAEGNRKHYPVKKLLLLLWKVLLCSVGDTKRLKDLKNASRAIEGLPRSPSDNVFLKSTPQDYHNYHLITATRYPTYVTPSVESISPSGVRLAEPLPTSIRRQLQQPPLIQPFTDANELLPRAFQESVELYRKHNYISLSSVQVAKEKTRMEREDLKKQRDDDGPGNMDLVDGVEDDSISHLGSERKRDVQAMRPGVRGGGKRARKEDSAGLKRIELLYRHILPNMGTYIGMLIRLLYYVNLGNIVNSSGAPGKQEGEGTSISGSSKDTNASLQSSDAVKNTWSTDIPLSQMTIEQKQDYFDRVDLNRHKEVVTKAVSAILLLLLKAAKCHHALKFEYIAQLLVDNNCAILILKMLSTWLQIPPVPSPTHSDPDANGWPDAPSSGSKAQQTPYGMASGWLSARDEPAELNFFHFCQANKEIDRTTSADVDPMDVSSDGQLNASAAQNGIHSSESTHNLSTSTFRRTSVCTDRRTPSCFRNFFTAISLLRILQKLTKSKTHRVLALVQWKASAVLKRVMKVHHVGLQLYALKLLKSQIPFLGKKWRSSNMKVITAIYMHLRPYLKDDFLSGDVDVDVDEALAQEQGLRLLISSYHENRYGGLFSSIAPTPGDGEDSDSHVDELDLILSLSRRVSYDDGDASHVRFINSGLRNPAYHDHLDLDVNFMENYEEWLRHEVYETDSTGSNALWNTGIDVFRSSPPNGANGDVSTADLPSIRPRSLFSATQRFSKEMLSDYYDDTEWTWDEDDGVLGIGTGVSMWDDHADGLLSPENFEDGEMANGWKWHTAVNGTTEGSEGSSDSGIGSWEEEDGERNRKQAAAQEDNYYWPDELPVQDAYVDVFDHSNSDSAPEDTMDVDGLT